MVKILGATVQNIVSWATKYLGYVKPCCESSVVAMWFPSEYHTCCCVIHTQNKIPASTVIRNSKISLGTHSEQDSNLQLCESVSSNRCHFRQ
jgi:hypothetical protein